VEALIGWSLLGAGGWWWLLRRTARAGSWQAPAGEWRLGDDIFASVLGLYFLLVILGGGREQPALKPEMIPGIVTFYGVLIVLVLAVVMSRGRSLVAAFGLATRRPFLVLGVGVLALALVYPLVELAVGIAKALGAKPDASDELVGYFRSGLQPADLAWAVALVLAAAPLFEEIVFRGYLYGVIKRHVGGLWAALTTAVLFAAVHQNLPAFPAYLLLGLALVCAYEITGSLWAPIVMHTLFNAISLVIILWFPEWTI
jgi:membrane protease YdiL (CAAX protease family)